MNKKELEKWLENNIDFTYSYSGGPGGQNVNKLNTKVIAKISIDKMTFLDESEKEQIKNKLKKRINNNNEIVMQVQEERTQYKNKKIAIKKIKNAVINSLKIQKKRIKTRIPENIKEKRIINKKKQSDRKKTGSFLIYRKYKIVLFIKEHTDQYLFVCCLSYLLI